MVTLGTEELMLILERRWFAEDKIAAAARAEIASAEQSSEVQLAQAARKRLSDAEQHKKEIMQRIEAAEDSLLD